MHWIETVTKEAFQLTVRDAVKCELVTLKGSMAAAERRLSDLERRISLLEESMKACDENIERMFAELRVYVLRCLIERHAGREIV